MFRSGLFSLRLARTGSVLALGLVAAGIAGLLQGAAAQGFDPSSLTGLYGARPIDAADLEDAGRAGVTRAYIPDAIDLSPLMPPPVQQEGGSCVAYAVAYAMRGYYSALESRVEPGAGRFTPSPAYVYSRIRFQDDNCEDAGSNTYRALRYFSQSGAPDRQSLPDEEMCRNAAEYAMSAPPNFRIRGFRFIYARHRDRAAPTIRHLDAIKQHLAAGHPVAVGFILPGSDPSAGHGDGAALQYLKHGETYHGSRKWRAEPVGGHAMLFVGYDERRQAFLVQNSWGPFWAGSGFGWISYAATRSDMTDAAVMVTDVVPPRPVPGLSGTGRKSLSLADDTCSDVYAVSHMPGAIPVMGGFVSSEASKRALADDLVGRYGAAHVDDVVIRPWPVCETLKTLSAPLAAPQTPSIRMLGGRTTLRSGDSLAFEVTAPDVNAFLYIVYLQADGSVVNLLPRRGPVRHQAAFGQSFIYGDGKNGRQKYTVKPPYGAEAIVVIAARSPISQLEDLEAENGGQFVLPASAEEGASGVDDRYFLSALRAGMAERPDATALGREISAAVLPLTIRQ